MAALFILFYLAFFVAMAWVLRPRPVRGLVRQWVMRETHMVLWDGTLFISAEMAAEHVANQLFTPFGTGIPNTTGQPMRISRELPIRSRVATWKAVR